uniref:CCA tRNA nucleotidyltransferase n=1 Tax=Caldisericum exile TaxID=693075 RepID=A0A7C4U0P9_9BACT
MKRDFSHLLTMIPQKCKTLLPEDGSYIVGGAVRDYLLGRLFFDFDFVVKKTYFNAIQEKIKRENFKFIFLNKEIFPLLRVFFNEITLDFTYYEDIEEDQSKRDFTINAIYVNVYNPDDVIHHRNSFEDIEKGVLRVCSDDAFRIDPVRYIRAFRFLCAYKLLLEPHTRALLKDSAPLYQTVKEERARCELSKLLKEDLENIETGIQYVYEDFRIDEACRYERGRNIVELKRQFNKDFIYLSFLKLYLISQKEGIFLFGLNEREKALMAFLNSDISRDFDMFFDTFYLWRNRINELILYIVSRFPVDEIDRFVELVRRWHSVKVQLTEEEKMLPSGVLKDIYRERLKEQCKVYYEDICHS